MPLHSTRPPLISLSGHKASQETKCPAVGHLDISRPTSLNNVKIMLMSPGICVRSPPNSLYDSVRRSKPAFGLPFFFLRLRCWRFSVGRQGPLFRVHPRLESHQSFFDLFLANCDLLLVVPEAIPRLLQGKQMLRPPIAFQGFSDRLFAGFDAPVS